MLTHGIVIFIHLVIFSLYSLLRGIVSVNINHNRIFFSASNSVMKRDFSFVIFRGSIFYYEFAWTRQLLTFVYLKHKKKTEVCHMTNEFTVKTCLNRWYI